MDANQQRLFGVPMTSYGEIVVNPKKENAMYQEIDEPVDVLVLFEKGTLTPQRFRWKGRVHKIERVTGGWHTDKGAFKVRHYAVMDDNANFFQLAYDERATGWKITRVWVE